jgi:hypothetical protein
LPPLFVDGTTPAPAPGPPPRDVITSNIEFDPVPSDVVAYTPPAPPPPTVIV